MIIKGTNILQTVISQPKLFGLSEECSSLLAHRDKILITNL